MNFHVVYLKNCSYYGALKTQVNINIICRLNKEGEMSRACTQMCLIFVPKILYPHLPYVVNLLSHLLPIDAMSSKTFISSFHINRIPPQSQKRNLTQGSQTIQKSTTFKIRLSTTFPLRTSHAPISQKTHLMTSWRRMQMTS